MCRHLSIEVLPCRNAFAGELAIVECVAHTAITQCEILDASQQEGAELTISPELDKGWFQGILKLRKTLNVELRSESKLLVTCSHPRYISSVVAPGPPLPVSKIFNEITGSCHVLQS